MLLASRLVSSGVFGLLGGRWGSGDWAAANQKKKDAIAELTSQSATMDDIDARINEPGERTRNLDLD